ncbi:EVE domain-containing protein [Nocardia sp. NBC_00565]|uniref:EVE domain-containing protein n=1 Tax=Nocardia sp. NBC_00565 TaxID=2975993 RepID=UPI002E80D9B8|nr:EVE domain-containing protein [Nocardia sp. NBC_00565]WUC00497.1 EVE domain-containing protein [Nocardia sp. NBC_00565]
MTTIATAQATSPATSGGRYWLGVVSREHVRRGVELGIAQVNHGKRTPLERMSPGDGFLCYSPREGMRTGAPIRSFTAIGTIDDGPVWQADPDDGGCFQPWRRAVDYRTDAQEIPIDELRAELDLTSTPNWGMALRRGLIELTAHDFALIARTMIGESAVAQAHE